jgi:hypothetical protein
MKHIVKLNRGKYIQLDSYGERPVNYVEAFLVGFLVISIASITAGAILGNDITKFIQMPNHSTQPTQPLKP